MLLKVIKGCPRLLQPSITYNNAFGGKLQSMTLLRSSMHKKNPHVGKNVGKYVGKSPRRQNLQTWGNIRQTWGKHVGKSPRAKRPKYGFVEKWEFWVCQALSQPTSVADSPGQSRSLWKQAFRLTFRSKTCVLQEFPGELDFPIIVVCGQKRGYFSKKRGEIG